MICPECLSIQAEWAQALNAVQKDLLEREETAVLPLAMRFEKMTTAERNALPPHAALALMQVYKRAEQHRLLTGHSGSFAPSDN
jgi:hypothetical protein